EVKQGMREAGIPEDCGIDIWNARLSTHNPQYTNDLYARLQRKGYLFRDAQRLVNTDRNVFGACMLAAGHADGMVTGVTRNFDVALNNVRLALDPRQGERLVGMSIILAKNRTLFMADTNISEFPSSEELAEIAMQAAHAARRLGADPNVAFVSYSNFGNPDTEHSRRVSGAVKVLDSRADVDFPYEGEMTPRMALNESYREAAFPFSRLKGDANVLVVPGLHSGSISTKLLGEIGEATVIGPLLIGLEKPVQIVQIGSRVSDIVTLAVMAAAKLDDEHRDWAAEKR
ncbi:MAG: phosphate acyltransferase, partial [Pseudomonadota bacterium]